MKLKLTNAFETVLIDLSHVIVYRFRPQKEKGKNSNRISSIKLSIWTDLAKCIYYIHCKKIQEIMSTAYQSAAYQTMLREKVKLCTIF